MEARVAPKFIDKHRTALVDLTLGGPRDLHMPHPHRSLSRFRDQAESRGIVESISEECLG